MRQLLETAQYAPTRGRFKVYMIDEVHMLSSSAFNAMLKTLEEPPEHVKFILATTDPQKIPVTVLSRCLQFNLKQMPPAAIVAHLERILGEEKVDFETEALSLIARAAAGSMRDALSLLDQAIAHGGGRVAARRGGRDARRHRPELPRAAARVRRGAATPPARSPIADEMQARSLSFDAALADLASLLLRMALAQSVAGRARRARRARAPRGARRQARSRVAAALLPDRAAGPRGPAARTRRARRLPHDGAAHARVPAGTRRATTLRRQRRKPRRQLRLQKRRPRSRATGRSSRATWR